MVEITDTTLIAIFTGITGVCTALSYGVAQTIYCKAKRDERIVFGPLDHPYSSVNPGHKDTVIACAVFNKSNRKGTIYNASHKGFHVAIVLEGFLPNEHQI